MKLTLVMAMTADGKIARHHAHFPDWTGRADKLMFKRLTEEAGVVIMGSKTYQAIGKPLPNRLNVVMTRNPGNHSVQNNLMFSSKPPAALLGELSGKGYQSAVLAGGATVNTLFVQQRLIDEMVLTISPLVFGKGIDLFADPLDVQLNLLSNTMLDKNVIVAHYKLCYPNE